MNPSRSKKRRFSTVGFLKLIRFSNLLIIGFTQYFAVIFLVAKPGHRMEIFMDFNLLLLVISTVLIAAAGYIINDYYDIKIDYVNKPDRVVVGKLIRRRIVLASHWTLNLLGIGIGLYLSLYVGVVNFIAGFLLWLYSNQLKRRPFIGNFVIALLTASSLFVIAIYYRQNINLLVSYAIFAFAINLIREVIKDMEDLRGDMRFGSKTLPIVWGLRKTKYFLYGLIMVFGGFFMLISTKIGDGALTVFFMVLVVPVLYFVYLLYRADSQRRFHQLSTYCKLLMLAGISSMAFY